MSNNPNNQNNTFWDFIASMQDPRNNQFAPRGPPGPSGPQGENFDPFQGQWGGWGPFGPMPHRGRRGHGGSRDRSPPPPEHDREEGAGPSGPRHGHHEHRGPHGHRGPPGLPPHHGSFPPPPPPPAHGGPDDKHTPPPPPPPPAGAAPEDPPSRAPTPPTPPTPPTEPHGPHGHHGHGPHGHGPHGHGCGRRSGRFGGRGGFGPGHHRGGHGQGPHGHHGPRGPFGPGHRHRGPGGPGQFPFDLNSIVEAFAPGLFGAAANNGASRSANDDGTFTPELDLFDTVEAYVLHLSLPGAKKPDLSITYSAARSSVTVSGVVTRPGVDEEMMGTLALDERRVGAFEREVKLEEGVKIDEEGISAKLEDGILRVVVPKMMQEDEEYVDVKKIELE